ncbi:MAG: hypothetical protein ACYC6L_06475 [Anaerolineae bacterium]
MRLNAYIADALLRVLEARADPARRGELVFTPLVREAMPLLRYRSGDLASWTNCGCWLPFASIALEGRLDDLILAGDLNLFGHILAEAAGRQRTDRAYG